MKDRLEDFEMSIWRGMKRTKRIDRVNNEENVNRIKENRTLLDAVI